MLEPTDGPDLIEQAKAGLRAVAKGFQRENLRNLSFTAMMNGVPTSNPDALLVPIRSLRNLTVRNGLYRCMREVQEGCPLLVVDFLALLPKWRRPARFEAVKPLVGSQVFSVVLIEPLRIGVKIRIVGISPVR
jgi:hypothetical protein